MKRKHVRVGDMFFVHDRDVTRMLPNSSVFVVMQVDPALITIVYTRNMQPPHLRVLEQNDQFKLLEHWHRSGYTLA